MTSSQLKPAELCCSRFCMGTRLRLRLMLVSNLRSEYRGNALGFNLWASKSNTYEVDSNLGTEIISSNSLKILTDF